jgi:CRP-like cAMP-binding protein
MLLVLTQAEIFRAVPRPYLAALAGRCATRAFRSGSVLMREGEVSDAMYVIVSGRVRVERREPDGTTHVLAELVEGQAVGEMGVLDHEPRSATVTVVEDSVLVELTSQALARTLEEFPQARTSVLQVLNRRPRSAATADEIESGSE